MLKGKSIFVFVAIVAVLCGATGCTGTIYVKETVLSDGTTVVQAGRAGVSGTDAHSVYIKPLPAPPTPPVEPKVITLVSTYEKVEDEWIAKCPEAASNPKQRKDWRHREACETRTDEVLVYPQTTPIAGEKPVFGFGSNPSPLNLFAPAAAIAGGMIGGAAVLRPGQTNIQQSGGGASATGGSASSRSRANANASAFASQNQRQGQDQDTSVSIDD